MSGLAVAWRWKETPARTSLLHGSRGFKKQETEVDVVDLKRLSLSKRKKKKNKMRKK